MLPASKCLQCHLRLLPCSPSNESVYSTGLEVPFWQMNRLIFEVTFCYFNYNVPVDNK